MTVTGRTPYYGLTRLTAARADSSRQGESPNSHLRSRLAISSSYPTQKDLAWPYGTLASSNVYRYFSRIDFNAGSKRNGGSFDKH